MGLSCARNGQNACIRSGLLKWDKCKLRQVQEIYRLKEREKERSSTTHCAHSLSHKSSPKKLSLNPDRFAIKYSKPYYYFLQVLF